MRAFGPPQGGHSDPAHSGRGDGGRRDGETGQGDATQASAAGPTELELDLHRECERLRGAAGAARGESEVAGRRIAAMEAIPAQICQLSNIKDKLTNLCEN